ncbi:MAG: hypothetical protein ABL971_06060 [Vicinamibacterales bacterium]
MQTAQSVQDRQNGRLSPIELVLPAVLLAAAEVARIRGFDQRVLLVASGTAIALGVWRLARRSSPTRVSFLRGVAAAALVSLMIALIPLALEAPGFTSVTSAVLPVVAMIAATLWLRWDEAGPPSAPARSPRARPGAWLSVALLVFAVLVTIANRMLVGDFPHITDEASYMLQAKWMGMPGFSWHFDPALQDFFTERHLIDRPGQLATLYPPGWPMVLALFDAAGLGSQWGLFVGSLTLLCTYRIGVLLHEHRVAVLAVVLLASSQWFLDMHASYMSHGATMMFAAGGTLAMLEADRRAGGQQAALWAAAGALLSFAVAARPLTGAALGAGLVLWIWLPSNVPFSRRVRSGLWLVVGALPGLAGLLYYNAATTGAPLLFGYEAVYGSMQSLGFGPRGWLVYNEALTRVPVLSTGVDFTPQLAATRFSMVLADAAMTWLPLFGLAPLLLAARHVGVRWQSRAWLPLLLLPAVYFFYFFKELRFWVEALPYFSLGIAWLFIRILDRAPALGRQLVAISLLGQAALVVTGDGLLPFANRPWRGYMPATAAPVDFEAIEGLRARHGKLLIFAKEVGPGFAPLRDRLMVYNGDGESGDVLVARDLGDRNAELMRRHPDRTPFLFTRTSSNGRIPATVTPLARVH